MNPVEAARLYQCALEEQRLVRERADELVPHEAVAAIERIEAEVEGAHAHLMEAMYR